MRVLITGDRGFVGAATRAVFENAGHEVVGFDIMDRLDVRDEGALRRVVEEREPDRILHLAAIARFADADAAPLVALSTNVEGTRVVARIASDLRVPLVYASTGSVYMPIDEDPPIRETFRASGNSLYGCTKYLGELLVQESASPWIILRYAHLYGPEKRGHGLVGGFLDRINRGMAPVLYGGQQSNDFTYIRDVARANLLAVSASWDCWRHVYNIGTGEELTATQAGRLVCDAFGYDGEVAVERGREVDAARFVYDTSKASRMLGFTAEYSFAAGLLDMAQARALKVAA
jgi:nucleoside-diphosphate-sugar epimerase